jgi:DNA-binding CsgD family transcriptional regulator
MAVEVASELSRDSQAEGSPSALTAQELEILQLLAFGSTGVEIAKQMSVSLERRRRHA